MKNRVTVTIAGETYTIRSEDGEEYIKRVAQEVDEEICRLREALPVSDMNAAVLAALNFADRAEKSAGAADNMRAQMKSYLDDASRLRSELNEARREIAKIRPNGGKR